MTFENSDHLLVSAEQMRQVEGYIFQQGMPVAALMEKAASLIVNYIKVNYPLEKYTTIGFIIGCGHNGGDGLVVARELYFLGYQPLLYCPLNKLKDLTQNHLNYNQFIGISLIDDVELILDCDLIIDALFGFGLERPITDDLAILIEDLNDSEKPILSIDLPSGIHSDTGEVLGTAIQATESLCLGLWKRAYGQDVAIPYLGQVTKLDFGIPIQAIQATLNRRNTIQAVTKNFVQDYLPLRRSPLTHKYQQGHLLLIGGSQTYAGSIVLAALGARATGMGMVTIAVPQSLKQLVLAQLPEALVIGCPEDETGAIAQLPTLDFSHYQAIACGCGLTFEGATNILPDLMFREIPLILDADALNWLAEDDLDIVQNRVSPTILTPHLGEFRRLFLDQIPLNVDRITSTQIAAKLSQAIALLKGAKTIIAQPDGHTYCLMESTPALARGGSGDVLLGMIGGLLCQMPHHPLEVTATAAWWHAQAGILAAAERTLAGVDGVTLTQFLPKVLQQFKDV